MKDDIIKYEILRKNQNKDFIEKIIEDLSIELPNHRIDDYFHIKKNIFTNSEVICLAFDKIRCVGLISLKRIDFLNKKSIYIQTLFISERYHRKSFLAYKIISEGFKGLEKNYGYFPDYILMTTYNPITYKLMKYFSKQGDYSVNLYPNLNKKNTDYHISIAREYSKIISPNCDFVGDKGIILDGGKISSSFWKENPTVRNSEVMSLFSNLNSNDRLLCILFCEKDKDKEIIKKNLKVI